MRYTRYNCKRKNNLSPFLIRGIIAILICAVAGIGVAKFIFGGIDIKNIFSKESKPATTEPIKDQSTKDGFRIVFVQCGVFSKKENVDSLMTKIQNNYNAFLIEENGEFRVSAGIYTKDKADSVISELSSSNIETSKMEFVISQEETAQEQIALIMDGYLSITDTLRGKDVKAIDTKDFKEWMRSLGEIESGKNIEELESIKKVINNLPEKITRDQAKDSQIEIYKILLKFKI